MEEKLIKTLIEQYKRQGVDLYAIVDDPLFMELPLESKIRLLKQFASHITSGTARGLTKSDIHSVLVDATMGASVSGIATAASTLLALKMYTKGKIPVGTVLGAIGLGAGVTAAGTIIRANNIFRNRRAMVHSLDEISKNPTDENAVRTLFLRNQQIRPNSSITNYSNAKNIASDYISNLPMKIMEKIPHQVSARVILKNEDLRTDASSKINGSVEAQDEMARKIEEAHRTASFRNLFNV